MDVTRIISQLRSEREQIEQAIRSLEEFDRLSTRPTEAKEQIRDRRQEINFTSRNS